MTKDLHAFEDFDCGDVTSAIMSAAKGCPRQADGTPFIGRTIAYHLENERLVNYLERLAQHIGVEFVEGKIVDVQRAGPSTGMPTRTQQSDVLCCAYASHGDTKHVPLFPEDPYESFHFAADAFDLADRLQTPIFVMLDLDIGMNERLCKPFDWDDSRRMDRGKVMTAADLSAGKDFGRYLDVDGDGIPYRTYPGTHPSKGSYFTRGTSRDRYARYTEEGDAYVDNMQRLLRKFETAKEIVPKPIVRNAPHATRFGVVYYGSTAPAMHEALDLLNSAGLNLNAMRIRAFPFADEVLEFVAAHDDVFVVEQNRDAQLRTLLINEGALNPAMLTPVLHYDGTPITAQFIADEISQNLKALNVPPQRSAKTDEAKYLSQERK